MSVLGEANAISGPGKHAYYGRRLSVLPGIITAHTHLTPIKGNIQLVKPDKGGRCMLQQQSTYSEVTSSAS